METMNVKDFYYDLPQELIAQDPLKDRSASRLLVMHRDTGALEHRVFKDIVDYLRPGDCLVINDTKVIPARLFGVKADTGAKIEVLLLKRRDQNVWETLVKPGKKCRPGTEIVWARCPCPLTSPISLRTRTAIRPSTQSMTALRRLLLQDCISQRSFCSRSRIWE